MRDRDETLFRIGDTCRRRWRYPTIYRPIYTHQELVQDLLADRRAFSSFGEVIRKFQRTEGYRDYHILENRVERETILQTIEVVFDSGPNYEVEVSKDIPSGQYNIINLNSQPQHHSDFEHMRLWGMAIGSGITAEGVGDASIIREGEFPREEKVAREYKPHGLFKRGIKKFATLEYQQQLIEIGKIKEVESCTKYRSKGDVQAKLNLGWAGNYEIVVIDRPKAYRKSKPSGRRVKSWLNPFISQDDNHVCLGNMEETYERCYNNGNYLECVKILIAVLTTKNDGNGYRRWPDCNVKKQGANTAQNSRYVS